MKKILVPCDFSAPAIEAFKFAIDLATKSGGSIVVLKVIDLPTLAGPLGMPTYSFDESLLKEIQKDAERNYQKMLNKFAKGFTNISFSVEQGRVSLALNEFIEKSKCDLVVMGTHGTSGMEEFLVGSNTEKIVRFSKVPVFTIRKAIAVKSIKHIVFPTDLRLDKADFIKNLKSLQEFFGAKLHILFLNTPFNFIRDNELKDYASHYKFTNYTLSIRQDRYEPDGIISFAQEMKADMLAMATHGRKGLAHFISGSITEDVVNHVKIPIWTYAIQKK